MSASRPSRYALELPVWYRATGERRWHEGTTESVSRSGAIIRTSEKSGPTGMVKVIIELPHEDDDAAVGCLTGIGRVVRCETPNAGDESSLFAIAVKHYRVDRRDRVSTEYA